ncbi:hypothetical protein OF83DRAFT_1172965 [Amylostereum chailletii]|nr:hypothetical protein OF83DRAFT_1172965 [Amylostereum chailletii]
MEEIDDSSAPVHVLPVELLSRIFLFLPRFTKTSPLDPALTLSLVCRRWRSVALQCKRLWNNIPTRNGLELTKLAIERSSPVPIIIEVYREDVTPSRMGAVKMALQQMERVQELVLCLGKVLETEMYDVLQALQTPAPLLERFTISMFTRNSPLTFSFPDQMFSDITPPRLRHLDVSRRIIDTTHFPSGPLTDLHSLVLRACHILPTVTILQAPLSSLWLEDCRVWENLGQLLTTLSNLSHLAELVLINVQRLQGFPQVLHPLVDGGVQSVELAHLTRFALEDSPFHISLIFPALRLPLSADIHIRRVGQSSNEEQHLGQLSVALDAHFSRPSTDDIRFQRLVLHSSTVQLPNIVPANPIFCPRGAEVSFTATAIPYGEDTSLSLGTFQCAFGSGFSNGGILNRNPSGEWLRMLFRLTFVRRVPELYIDSVPMYNKVDSWLAARASFNSIRKVCAAGIAVQGLVGALETMARRPMNLEEVCIVCADFGQDDNALLGTLQTAMYALEKEKRAPKVLKLNRCATGPGTLGVLRRTLDESIKLEVQDW